MDGAPWGRQSSSGVREKSDSISCITLQTAVSIIVTMKTAVIVTPFYFTINPKLNWNTVEMTSQPAIMVTIIDGSHFTVTIIVNKCLYCNKNSKAFVVNFIVTHAFIVIRYSFTMNFSNNYGKRFSVYRECSSSRGVFLVIQFWVV